MSKHVPTPSTTIGALFHDMRPKPAILRELSKDPLHQANWEMPSYLNFLDKCLQDKDIEAKKGKLFKADYQGMGWMLVRKNVFESLKYPWFHPRLLKWKNHPNWADFCFDDVEFCLRARENGYDIFIDPGVRLGHEKIKIL